MSKLTWGVNEMKQVVLALAFVAVALLSYDLGTVGSDAGVAKCVLEPIRISYQIPSTGVELQKTIPSTELQGSNMIIQGGK